MPTAFIIHGQDRRVREELEKFLKAVGFTILPFHAAAAGEAQVDAVLRNVESAVKQADVVIVLFTPEEHASFHDPETGRYVASTKTGEQMGGWQPRPNVIFEAGIAVASAKEKTILLRIGSVRVSSDLAGLMFVDLDADNAKDVLLNRLRDKVKDLRVEAAPADNHPGDFRVPRNRWPHHDELGELESELAALRVPGSRKTVLMALLDFLAAHRKSAMWNSSKIIQFISKHVCRDRKDDGSTNWVFWQLMITGVFAFDDIDENADGWADFEKELWWDDMQEYVSLTPRGLALLRKLDVMRAPP
jgi:hypothetical protein